MHDEAPNGSISPEGGIVVVRIGCGVVNLAAIEAAALVAKSYQAGLEGLFIEDEAVLAAATYTFTREISYFSGRARAITHERVAADMRGNAVAAKQRLHAAAAAYRVPLAFRILRRPAPPGTNTSSPSGRFWALSQASVVAGGNNLFDLIAETPDAEGFIIAGAAARRLRGPFVALAGRIEDFELLRPPLDRLMQTSGRSTLILPSLPDPRLLDLLRRELAGHPLAHGRLLAPVMNSVAAVEQVVRRADAGLVVLSLDHPLAASRAALAQLAASLSTPLLLLRTPNVS